MLAISYLGILPGISYLGLPPHTDHYTGADSLDMCYCTYTLPTGSHTRRGWHCSTGRRDSPQYLRSESGEQWEQLLVVLS